MVFPITCISPKSQSFIQDFVYNNFKRIIPRHFKPSYDISDDMLYYNVHTQAIRKSIEMRIFNDNNTKKNSYIIKPHNFITSKRYSLPLS